jgi:phage N-6-adenine-methyltransferase
MNTGFNVSTKQSDEWQTPQWLFDALDSEFGFTLDGAATPSNAKCKLFSTINTEQDWSNHRVFCNPPYSDIETFVVRAFDADIAVLLLPVRTDSDWHRMLIERKVELRYFRRRINFLENGVEMTSPRFASLIAIVKGR